MKAERLHSPSNNHGEVRIDRFVTVTTWFFGVLGLCLPLSIVGFLIVRGLGVISWEFLTTAPGGLPLGVAGGIMPAIQGSLELVGLGLLFALPLGVGGAIYLSEYCTSQALLKVTRFVTECLAGIPAIVYGLFGYSFLVVAINLKASLMAGSITLGLVMFPLVLIGSHESMRSVDWEYRESALALGVSRSYVVRRVVLKQTWPSIMAITLLAAGHAVGSASPVLYTASIIYSRGGLDLKSPVMTLPTHLYYLVSEAISFEHAYGTALVLTIGLLLLNFTGRYLKRLSSKYGV